MYCDCFKDAADKSVKGMAMHIAGLTLSYSF